MTGPVMVPGVVAATVKPRNGTKQGDPCIMVIFGATGDLTHRKLLPAIWRLALDGGLPEHFAIIGIGREAFDRPTFCAAMRAAAFTDTPQTPENMALWQRLESNVHYMGGDLDDPGTYGRLKEMLAALERDPGGFDGRLFYLAIPPSLCEGVITNLSESGVLPHIVEREQRPWARLIIEKPFGRDLTSAMALNAVARRAMAEHQVYRIDHYLGKETVQNLLVLRFANSIFEPIWNRHHIHHVQITTGETVGVEHRGAFYEEAGVVRDVFQNHLLQLLTLTAMEPPVSFRADAVRDEKVKVMHALRTHSADELHDYAVRGQYGPGMIDGLRVPGYREEEHVAADSSTPTYAAIRFMIDNWRWQGVPFFVRSGKRLPTRATEIAIQFRRPPHLLFLQAQGAPIAPNVLAIRIQPSEGISLRFEVKVPGFELRMSSVEMVFDYAEGFGTSGHDAYEALLLDCMIGEATLFIRSDETETAWEVLDPLIAHWESHPPLHFPNYPAGSWGPLVADEFIARDGARWRSPGETVQLPTSQRAS